MLFFNFSWFEYRDEIYKGKTFFKEKFMLSLSNWRAALDFFPRTLYMRFFLIMAYGGILFSFLRKKYFLLVLLIGGVMMPMPLVIFSHIEDRYVMMHFWVLSFFVAYCFYELRFFIGKAFLVQTYFQFLDKNI